MKNGILLNNTYRILGSIGTGGLGEIYLGYHENLQKYVVIKKVKDHCTSLLNNRIEVDILKSLHHTYLPQVYDFIENEEGVFTVMEYISGHDLKYLVDAGYQFEEKQLIFWMKQLCEVLDYLHNRRPAIIHCDIKPGNIMITEEGNLCLIDFNISLDGENNKDLVGLSSAYASPEQVKKAEYKMRYGSGDMVKMDARTDLYSVGAVFYYLVSGIRPNAREERLLHLTEMDLPYNSSFLNIIEKAMEREPARRFRTAAKMRDALEHQEKWETQYLKLWKTGILMDAVAAGVVLALICPLVFGWRGMRAEEFEQVYSSYINMSEELLVEGGHTVDAILSEGVQLLSRSEFEDEFSGNPEMLAQVLSTMGQAALQNEDYDQACEYLEEAASYTSESSGLYRNLTIAYAKNGSVRNAKKALEKAVEEGLDKMDGYLLEAEIAIAKEDYQSAWSAAVKAAESPDEEIAERAAYYLLEVGEYTGNYAQCLGFLQEMQTQASGVSKYIWIRKQGELSFRLYEKGEKEYLSAAAGYYETLYAKGYAQINDLYNLETCYMEQNRLRTSEQLLLQMKENYPQEYKIPMRLGYNCYRQQNEKGIQQKDYESVIRYFDEACTICEEAGMNWEEDTNMLQLQSIVEQLISQGWIED